MMRDNQTFDMPLRSGGELDHKTDFPADDLARGVSRMLRSMGFAPLVEFKLGNSRRADVAGLNRRGMMAIVEIKTAITDLKGDRKWPEYLAFCDCFYFAIPPAFQRSILEEESYLPDRAGLIIADRFGGQIIREAREIQMNAARRRTETIRFARKAAARLHRLDDPGL